MILENFLTTSFQNVRSSKRTDELHTVLLNEVLNANPDLAELPVEEDRGEPEWSGHFAGWAGLEQAASEVDSHVQVEEFQGWNRSSN